MEELHDHLTAKGVSYKESEIYQIMKFASCIHHIDHKIIDSLIDVERSPLSNLLQYALYQLLNPVDFIHRQQNFEFCMDCILTEVRNTKMISIKHLENLKRIEFILRTQALTVD